MSLEKACSHGGPASGPNNRRCSPLLHTPDPLGGDPVMATVATTKNTNITWEVISSTVPAEETGDFRVTDDSVDPYVDPFMHLTDHQMTGPTSHKNDENNDGQAALLLAAAADAIPDDDVQSTNTPVTIVYSQEETTAAAEVTTAQCPSTLRNDNEEVLFELDVPVSDDLASLWNCQETIQMPDTVRKAEPDPMACFNPLHVEGKTVIEKKAAEIMVCNGGNSSRRLKSKREQLPRLIIPESSQTTTTIRHSKPAQTLLDTPSVDKALAHNAGLAGFDLLEWVTNTELPVNDPGFMALIGDTSANDDDKSKNLRTLDLSAINYDPVVTMNDHPSPSKGKRRPYGKASQDDTKATSTEENDISSKQKRYHISPHITVLSAYLCTDFICSSKRRSQRQLTVQPIDVSAEMASTSSAADHSYNAYDVSSNTSGESSKDAKYRRMRDLNNMASKRCRQNR